MWEQVKTYGYGGNGQNDSREEKEEAPSSQEDESKEIRLLDFQGYYVNDYITDKEGRLEKDNKKYDKSIYICFNFQESLLIPDIYIYQTLHLYNPQQFESILNHYYNQSNVFRSVMYHPKYKGLCRKINERKTFQPNIDKRIDELSKYLTFTFEDNLNYGLIYTNLNRSTLPLAINHLRLILLVLETWIYRESDSNRMNRLMREVSKQCKNRLSYKSFGNHYIDNLLYVQSESPLITLRINLNFKLNDIEHSLNKTLNIRNIDQFKTILRFYNSDTQKDFIPLEPSSKYKDIDTDITYRNTLQVRINKVLDGEGLGICFNIEEDEYDPLTLNLDYYSLVNRFLTLSIRHLELITLTFKTGNDDTDDKNVMDIYLSEVKDRFIPLLKDESGKSSGDYYIHYGSKYLEKPTTNTLHLNLHIILKQYQSTITKTLQLQEPERFIKLPDYHSFLPNGYLTSSKSFDTSLYNLLYIFDQDKDNPSTLNLYYYPLSNELDPSLIIKHLELMLSSFKTLNQEVSNININPTDIITFSQYLSSITVELQSLSTSFSPTQSFQHHFITQYQNKLTESLPITNLNIHFRLLLKDFNFISNTYPLTLSSINQLLSLLHHYSLRKDPLDPSGIEVYKEHTDLYKEITYRSRLQVSYDKVLSKLSKRVSFRMDKDPKDPSNLGIEYIDLEGSDVPYAVKHLDTMMMVYKAGNYSPNDKLEVDNFVFLMREHVEEGFTSRLDPNISNRLDTIVSNPDKAKKDSENDMIRLVDSRLDDMIDGTRDGLGSLKGKDDETEDDKVSFLPRDVNAMDGRLGGASTDIPNLLEVSGNDISMMEDVD